jgi:gliding motility-associated-like protein
LGDPAVITASGGDSYRWFIEDSILVESSNKLTKIPVATTYFKVAISQVACKMDDTLFATVNIFPRPVTLVSKSNDIDCASTEAQLTASGGISYEWFPKEGLSNAFIFNPIASPWQTTKYQVNIKSTHGCLVEDSITIKVSSNGESGFYIPSAFTPNGDGINDCFNIKSLGNLKEFTILIYNRWGEKVFQSNSSSFCWNGIYKSIEQPSGTFVYYIKVKALCGDVFRKGTVILIR